MNKKPYNYLRSKSGYKFILFILILLSWHVTLLSQSQKVYLNNLTFLEEEGVHLVTFSTEANETLVLPKLNKNETEIPKKYMNLFYSWDTELDENISVILYQLKNEDLLYVDKNNDNDLSNDGDPILFPLNKDSVTISISLPNEKNNKLKLALFRKPNLPDSLMDDYVDEDGNISSRFLGLAKLYSKDFNYEDKNRSFYFDYRLTLRTGELKIDSLTYSIGLFDYSNNGLYDDKRDLFLIDLNKSGKLNLWTPSNIFSIDDVFSINNKNYKLSEVDKFGKYFVIEPTIKETTFKYLTWVQKESSHIQMRGVLKDDFWNISMKTLNGEKTNLSAYKGKYLFINFWGEWCLPCLYELEELKYAYNNYKDKVVFLGILQSNDIVKAKKVIIDKNILWENNFINEDIQNEFNIKAYPSNILIYPDGKNYLKMPGINRTFFDLYIK